jgi:hypothetical protein
VRKSAFVLIALVAISGLAGCGSASHHAAIQSSPTTRLSVPPTSTGPGTGLATTAPSTRPASAAAQQSPDVVPDLGVNRAHPVAGVLLNVEATGSLVTQSFSAPATWRIAYMTDCSNLSGAGAFRVSLQGAASKLLVNIQTNAQTAIVPEQGAGTYHLVIGSACSYLLQALPGTGT